MTIKNRCAWLAAPVALCHFYLAALAIASEGPSTRGPENLLPVGPFEFSHKAYQRAAAKYQEAADRAKAVLYGQSADNSKKDDASEEDEVPKKGKPRKKGDSSKKDASQKGGSRLLAIGQAHTSVVQAQREVRVLGIFGEPAAVDLQFRLKQWQGRLDQLRKTLLNDAKTAELVQKSVPKWLADAESLRRKKIPKAQQLAEKGRWQDACEELYELGDELRPRLFWYDGQVFLAGFKPIVDTLLPIEPEHLRLLREHSDEAIEQLLADAVSGLQIGVQEIEGALRSAQEGGRGRIGGKELGGPELLSAVAASSRRLCVAIYQARSLCWRWHAGHEKPSPHQPVVEQACGKLASAIAEGSRRLIEADAARTQPADVAALYQRYLQALASLAAGDATGSLASDTRQALEKLAAGSPPFAAEVAAYARVTGEVLRWRERFASARAAHAGGYVDLDSALKKVHEQPRNRPKDAPSIEPWRLGMAAPEFIQGASAKLVPLKVSVIGVLAPSGQVGPAFSRYRNRAYARIAPGPDLRNLAAELRSDLWVSAAAPPLTLDALIAIDTAERGDCERAGGAVESLELQALATRFAAVGEDDRGVVGLGPLPAESKPRTYLEDYLFAVDVKPVWFLHRYGFVTVEK
ncbi:MAG TPA: hypothetical protein VND64_14210 [Pirellulales bacterium]|nr:hypothetical protein [Pirellulales bacterium]